MGNVARQLAIDTLEDGPNGVLWMMFHVELSIRASGGLLFAIGCIRMFHVEQIINPMGEIGNWIVAHLDLGLGEVNGAPQKPRRGAGLEPAEFQSNLQKGARESERSGFTRSPTRMLILPNVH